MLAGAAKTAHDRMLEEILADKRTSISSSRLMNWIAADYFEHFFNRRKEVICREHINERKCLQEAMKVEDPNERRRALQEAIELLGISPKTPRGKKPKATERADEPELT